MMLGVRGGASGGSLRHRAAVGVSGPCGTLRQIGASGGGLGLLHHHGIGVGVTGRVGSGDPQTSLATTTTTADVQQVA